MKIDFKTPFEFEGKTYEGLDLKFDDLKGRDIVDAEKEAMDLAKGPVTDLSKVYQICVAARAADVVPDMILALPAAEFVKVSQAAQNFLLLL